MTRYILAFGMFGIACLAYLILAFGRVIARSVGDPVRAIVNGGVVLSDDEIALLYGANQRPCDRQPERAVSENIEGQWAGHTHFGSANK